VLAAAGLKPTWDWKEKAADGSSPRPTLGIRTRHDGGQFRVAAVIATGPAYRAGISADDEIIALDGYRVTDDATLRERLHDRRIGDRVALLLFRREELRTIEVELAAGSEDKLTIERVAEPSEIQQQIYESWLDQRAQTAREYA
jgi:predicted metalloprotease with PDZ domain